MIPIISSRTPGGGPLSGALKIVGTNLGYPIVDSIARLTPELAERHSAWLQMLNLQPPPLQPCAKDFQPEATVDSWVSVDLEQPNALGRGSGMARGETV